MTRQKSPTKAEYEQAILDVLADGKPHGMPEIFAAVLHLRRNRGLWTPKAPKLDRAAAASYALAAVERLRLREAIWENDDVTYEAREKKAT